MLILIRWMVIYPLDSIIQSLYSKGYSVARVVAIGIQVVYEKQTLFFSLHELLRSIQVLLALNVTVLSTVINLLILCDEAL